ncbi:MAG TPA: DCC1-like thiol-disulfide oxidoreductase family protein [Aquihabitans sp.]|nr:DCC1-like thiol-disulfide oxidoreductase family protein [Aquihabitans sp.]
MAAGPAAAVADPRSGVGGPAALTVFYDPGCELCRRCRAWLEVQPTWVPLRFVEADAAARRLLPQLPWLGTELVVVGDDGAAWIGPAAFLTCLWATERYRPWSRRLSGPAFAPLAERFFASVSSHRGRIAGFLAPDDCEQGTCRHQVDPTLGLDRRRRRVLH